MTTEPTSGEELAFFGTITAGLSHELKNVIATINEYNGLLDDLAQAAARRPLDPERLRQICGKITKQIERGESLILGLNRFAHSMDEPIRDICGLLESAGVKVLSIKIASDAFFGLSVAREDGGPAIVVNTWERIAVERWIFTAAHELGHLLLHLDAYDAADGGERPGEEKEADTFAAHLLLPEGAFEKEWAASGGLGFVDRVLKLKRIFRVSYRTVLYRLSENPSFGKKVWARFQALYAQKFGHTLQKADEPEALGADAFRAATERAADEPDRLSPTDFAEDRLRLLVRRAVEREVITLARGAEILGTGVGEMRDLASSWFG